MVRYYLVFVKFWVLLLVKNYVIEIIVVWGIEFDYRGWRESWGGYEVVIFD